MMARIILPFWRFQLCGEENRMEGWTGMEHLLEGDVREAGNRVKFPPRGN